jgi:hypothetical protein
MSTQGKQDEGFELVTTTSLSVMHSQLSYPLIIVILLFDTESTTFYIWYLH